MVKLLPDRAARLDINDTLYSGTTLDWALYLGRTAIAAYLTGVGAPGTY